MRIGKVVGNIWATRKEEGLRGLKLLIVELQLVDGKASKDIIVAADRIGAGVDDRVIITTGNSASRTLGNGNHIPIDAIIVGIIDSTEERGD